jgi:uncharacterized membrane protein
MRLGVVSIHEVAIQAALLAAQATPKAGHVAGAHQSHRTMILSVGLAIGIIIVILAIPLLIKKVKPNRVYGLTFVLAQESNRTWYAANQFFGACLLVAGLITVVGTLVIWGGKLFRSSNKGLVVVEVLLVVAPVVIAYLVAAARFRSR